MTKQSGTSYTYRCNEDNCGKISKSYRPLTRCMHCLGDTIQLLTCQPATTA